MTDTIKIRRADTTAPILQLSEDGHVSIKAGTTIEIDGTTYSFPVDSQIPYADMMPGNDYAVGINTDGDFFTRDSSRTHPISAGVFGGFHFAPRSHADDAPAINPYSFWDIGFRPACPDPRGMTLIERDGGNPFWADIYLLGVNHDRDGTSRCGVTIADGRDLPNKPDGEGRYSKLDYATAVEIYAHHGKRLLGAEEFFAAAYGVKERCSRDDEPTLTGSLDDNAHSFISARGLFDATGTMWQWGTDGHPDDPRPSVFGGSWLDGEYAGTRCASLVYWAEDSVELLSARGASDHLAPV